MSQYSFADVVGIVSHPSYGQFSTQGTGVGSWTVTMSTDRTSQDVAADGEVMTSKVEGKNGNIAINIQQNSPFNQWLRNLYNFVDNGDASLWNEITITLRSNLLGDFVVATGGAIQKLPDLPYQADGQKVNWTLMFEEIDEMVV